MKTQVVPVAHIDHAGFNVPDLDVAVAFFTDALGFELQQATPVGPDPAGGHTPLRLATVACRGIRVELLEYQTPDDRHSDPVGADPAGRHLALYVDDFDRSATALASWPGLSALHPPTRLTDGSLAGTTFQHFAADWGLDIELIHRETRRGNHS